LLIAGDEVQHPRFLRSKSTDRQEPQAEPTERNPQSSSQEKPYGSTTQMEHVSGKMNISKRC